MRAPRRIGAPACDTPVPPGAPSYFLEMERQVLEPEAPGGPHAMATRYLVDADGEAVKGASEDDLRDRLRAGTFFWLDLHRPEPSDLALLRDVFQFHPLAVEDAESFGQRPKVDPYDDFSFVVAYGSAPDEDGVVEVHCFVSERFLVSVHHDICPPFASLQKRYAGRHQRLTGGAMLLQQVVDSLVDSFFPALETLDDRIDTVQQEIFDRPREEQLQEIFTMKQRLIMLRRVIGPQRDMVTQVVTGSAEVPGMDDESRRYFRDIEDHLLRLSDMVNSYRDLLSGAIDVYLSSVANRRDQVVKQLTVLATIFLPITFLTGFFGQNFGYMVTDLIGSREAFVVGTLIQVATVAAILGFFKARGWI